MFQIGKTLISEEIIEKDFVCNLNACKGACCVEGESGAPLTDQELPILEKVYKTVKPYLRKEGIKAIEEQGTFVKGWDGEWETPLVNHEECAYVVFAKDGMAKCALEEAYNDGLTDWKKPVSCHLYPVRTREYSAFTAVNYHKWAICDDACTLGAELKVPIYKFVKEALVRKFGADWYQELEEVAAQHLK
ncbi:hypothetical protein BUL40_00610 [Croceivirga radicis]|uniref:DUF3109 domain-containing protein n=1 Tax=Croceivirga radicis TaxID=1929488 RepID=A0A1V6LVC2_9FLAO|nr:DUF3109 family protein [Croceivirga radicis]OQD44089.1 hypothetical protein BUL40_00610 [Croceivirga radicis]